MPTRNRPDELLRLLDSLVVSSIQPTVVVVVASGTDVWKEVQSFKDRLKIIYEHTSISGQVNQKSHALSLLPSNIDWCVFSDDDLLFSETAISEAIRATYYQDLFPIMGIGFALPSKSRIANLPSVLNLASRAVGLSGRVPGAVLKSGQGVNYLDLSQIQKTEWLNGVSMWKYPEVMSYVDELPSSEYAACEDLIFSYAQGKKGVLLFAPEARVNYQDGTITNPENPKVFISAAYWRLLFVRRHTELSVGRFFVAQFCRAVYATTVGGLAYKKVYLKSFLFLLKDHLRCPQEVSLFLKLKDRIAQYENSKND